jgi:hypothetical protein
MRQVIIIIAAIGAAGLLTSCGAATGAVSQGTTSPGTPAHPHDCGSAITHVLGPSTQVFTASAGALTCFSAAARACEPAALIEVTLMGVDSGTKDVFTIDAGGTPKACAVTETSQFYMVPPPPTQSPAQVAHGKVAGVTSAGVTLSVAGQTFLIPSSVTTHPTS